MYSARAPRTSRHFYPRPPRGGRPFQPPGRPVHLPISIHALREEGDCSWKRNIRHIQRFLSTPSARRATVQTTQTKRLVNTFLSTPSARRATPAPVFRLLRLLFLSTPSARRATRMELEAYGHSKISIHALREEGDYKSVPNLSQAWIFLSTPSARRATPARARLQLPAQISIHALREEGDG